MSTFSSLCRKHDNDPIDVAYDFANDWVRLWIPFDRDNQESTIYLSVKEAQHVIELMQLAIKNIKRTYVKQA